jgi:hypothetical protein
MPVSFATLDRTTASNRVIIRLFFFGMMLERQFHRAVL